MTNITIKYIAEQLNLSKSTISRALQNNPRVNLKTKERVWKLAKELDYNPNKIARSLAIGASQTLGVIIPEIRHNFYSQVIDGIEDVVLENNYNIMICKSDENYDREVKAVHSLLSSQVDGIVISLSRNTKKLAHLKQIISQGKPLVLFNRTCNNFSVSQVVSDDYTGAYDAACHLIKKGCERILHLAGPMNVSNAVERYLGYKNALIENNIRPDEKLIIPWNKDLKIRNILYNNALSSHLEIDGIFSYDDYMAYEMMLKMKEKGIVPGKDLYIIGYADEPISGYISPGLTTVSQPSFEMGVQVAKEFFRLIHDKNSLPEKIMLPVKLQQRGTA